MTERPIIFNSEMVRAILEGRKTQTRRPVKPQPIDEYGKIRSHELTCESGGHGYFNDEQEWMCPHGKPGDRLWVRETHCWCNHEYVDGYKEHPWEWPPDRDNAEMRYKATEVSPDLYNWRPSIHMPRWASRITLEITDVRVERVQEISEEDARAEGCSDDEDPGWRPTYNDPDSGGQPSCRRTFEWLWSSIYNAKGFGWDANPWVWVIEFRRVGHEV